MPHPILLVHGAWHGAWCWEDNVAPWLRDEGWVVHTIDLPGHGDRRSEGYRTQRIRDYVDAVETAIDGLDTPPIAVGHSMGGFVLQHLIARRTLPAAILVAPAPPFGVLDVTMRVALADPWGFARANLGFDLGPLVDSDAKARALFFSEDAEDATVRNCRARLQGESWLAFVEMLGAALPTTTRVDTPVTVIGGDQDWVFPPHIVRRTADRYGVAPVMVRGGHDLMLDTAWRATAEAVAAACSRINEPS